MLSVRRIDCNPFAVAAVLGVVPFVGGTADVDGVPIPVAAVLGVVPFVGGTVDVDGVPIPVAAVLGVDPFVRRTADVDGVPLLRRPAPATLLSETGVGLTRFISGEAPNSRKGV